MDKQNNIELNAIGNIETPAVEETQNDNQMYGTTSLHCEQPIY